MYYIYIYEPLIYLVHNAIDGVFLTRSPLSQPTTTTTAAAAATTATVSRTVVG